MGFSLRYLLLVFSMLSEFVDGQSESSLPAPSVPLAVKSPYLNAWINGASPGSTWPTFWTTNRILGWAGYVRVDGQTYQWLGNDGTAANISASYVTPTRSIFTMTAGSLEFNVTFLSPIEPADWNKQSFPFSYLYIDAKLLDNRPHVVQFYSDISGEWASSDNTNKVEWNTTETSSSIFHQIQRSSMQPMVEANDMAEDSTVYYAMAKRSDMTWQTGTDVLLRRNFSDGSLLKNIQDTDFRNIAPIWPVLAFAVDLGTITQTSESLVWAIGVVRDPLIRYVKGSGAELRSSYFRSKYDTVNAAVDDFLSDFDAAKTRALALDNKIMSDGVAVSTKYADLLALSLRQTVGAMDITVGRGSNGKWNTSDVKIFMKDIGTGRRVNAVETLYAALPALLYLNASLAGPLLDSLLEYQASPRYLNSYAATDLGASYPNALGNNTDISAFGVENCGNMLIMTYAHAQKSGDESLIARYYDLLKKWANFLVANSLHTNGSSSADGQVNPDMSNLAIKGITGVFAMSKISEALEKPDASDYKNKAIKLVTDWEGLAISSNHITTYYGVMSSWSLIYNLYAARLLNFSIDDQLYQNQDAFYASQASAAPQFGFPYDTNAIDAAKSQWTMFTAATTTSSTTRDMLVSMVYERAFFNGSVVPFPTTYNTNNGSISPIGGQASPAQGAMFSLLALNTPDKLIALISSPSKSGPDVAVIAGAVVGGVALILAILGLAYFFSRRRQQCKVMPRCFGIEIAPSSTARTCSSLGVLHDEHHNALPPPIMTTKAAAAAVRQSSRMDAPYQNGYPKPQSQSTAELSSSGTYPSTTYPSTVYPSTAAIGDSSELRAQVEELRREMMELRAQRLQDVPPPLYRDLPAGNVSRSSAQPMQVETVN
ncbi:hypothetical protein BDQ12DRAFT_651125 [Crucibulum laeve]|uniref:DUF1793-domain-containing protein n=1 Tax=Crucibulum laeve TaxID=68775 RepID=A0A5C3M1C0_9AGAR|nr:hypothetical protein BDQ12DRAFT_651125 [Crucibulum laeve]